MSEVVTLDGASHVTERFYLTALRRKDDTITSVLCSTPNAALYEYNTTSQQWTKMNVEGSLCVVKRSVGPCRLIILNRCSPADCILDLDDSLEMHEKLPYLIFKRRVGSGTGKPDVFGCWFESSDDLARVKSELVRIGVRTHGGKGGATTTTTTTSMSSVPHTVKQTVTINSSTNATGGPSLMDRLFTPQASETTTTPRPEPSITLTPSLLKRVLSQVVQDDEFVALFQKKLGEVVASEGGGAGGTR